MDLFDCWLSTVRKKDENARPMAVPVPKLSSCAIASVADEVPLDGNIRWVLFSFHGYLMGGEGWGVKRLFDSSSREKFDQ